MHTMKSMATDQVTRHKLVETNAQKGLGVVTDRNLNFKDHVAQSTAKANRTVGIIRRSFDYLSDYTFIQLYKCQC